MLDKKCGAYSLSATFVPWRRLWETHKWLDETSLEDRRCCNDIRRELSRLWSAYKRAGFAMVHQLLSHKMSLSSLPMRR